MKDAKGHGSEKRGGIAPHQAGVDQVGRETWDHGSPNAAKIQREGFNPDVGKGSGYRGVLGVGVNVTDNKDFAAKYGKVLNVAMQPGLKMFHTNDMLKDVYNEHTNYGDPDAITRHFQSQGYHGIVVHGQGGMKTGVVFDPKHVRPKK